MVDSASLSFPIAGTGLDWDAAQQRFGLKPCATVWFTLTTGWESLTGRHKQVLPPRWKQYVVIKADTGDFSEATLATTLDEQHEIQQKIQKLEKQQRRQRQEIFQVEGSIIEKRDALIESLERRLTQKTESNQLFTISWEVM